MSFDHFPGFPAYSHQVRICHNDKRWEYDIRPFTFSICPPSANALKKLKIAPQNLHFGNGTEFGK